MSEMRYLDFDLRIERSPSGSGYWARVSSSPAGRAEAEFELPFSDLEIENFFLRVGCTRRGVRRLESPEMQAAKTFGSRLFETVFDQEVRGCLRSSLDEANRQGAGLRIRLCLTGVPELAELPWKYLHNTALNRLLVLCVGGYAVVKWVQSRTSTSTPAVIKTTPRVTPVTVVTSTPTPNVTRKVLVTTPLPLQIKGTAAPTPASNVVDLWIISAGTPFRYSITVEVLALGCLGMQ